MFDREMTLILADKDLLSLIAILAFGLISALGGALKKKAEAKKEAAARDSAREEFEQAELDEGDSPAGIAYPSARPVPPIPRKDVAQKPRPGRPAARRELSPDDVLKHLSVQIARKGSAGKPLATGKVAKISAIQPPPNLSDAMDGSQAVRRRGKYRVRGSDALRAAFVWTEILRPPVALRDQAGGWQDDK